MKGRSATKILLETLLLAAHRTVDQGVVASQRYGGSRQARHQTHTVVTQGKRWEVLLLRLTQARTQPAVTSFPYQSLWPSSRML